MNPREEPRRYLDWAISHTIQSRRRPTPTILDQDIKTLFDGKSSVEDNKAEAKREHIVAPSHFEEVSNRFLYIHGQHSLNP